MQRKIYAAVSVAVLALLLAFPAQATQGAKTGLELCAKSVIPSLFGFLVVTGFIMSSGAFLSISKIFARPVKRLFNLPPVCAVPFVFGLIGGYPSGLVLAAQLYKDGLCTRRQFLKMLMFTNNAGLGVASGLVGGLVFQNPGIGLLIYLCSAGSAVIMGALSQTDGPVGERDSGSGAGMRENVEVGMTIPPAPGFFAAVSSSIKKAAESMLAICASIVFFSVLTGVLNQSGMLDPVYRLFCQNPQDYILLKALITGGLEMVGGLFTLTGSAPFIPKALTACFLVCFGSFSVHMQGIIFLKGEKGCAGRYITAKFLQALLGCILCATYLLGHCVIIFLAIYLLFLKNALKYLQK